MADSDIDRMEGVLRRLDSVERNGSDLARSHTSTVEIISKLGGRVERLEEFHQESREERAARQEREKTLWENIKTIKEDLTSLKDLNMSTVKSDVSEIKDANKRMFWLVAGAIVTGFGGLFFLLVKGGLGV